MSNIFKAWCRNFHEYGYSVMPVIGKGQPIESGFQRFSISQPTEQEMDKFESLENNFNIGVVLGLDGLLALDIDYDGEERDDFLQGILAVSPPVTVAKKGKKGLTVFYRGSLSGKKIKHPFEKKKTVVEVLSKGNYTIVPPSIHSETRKPYVWTTQETLLDIKTKDLPVLTSEDLINIEIFVSDFFLNKKEKNGRNNVLGAMIFKMSTRLETIDEMVSFILEKDKELFGKDSYYNDPSESHGQSAYDFAKAHAERAISWVEKKKKESGIDWKFGKNKEFEKDLSIEDVIEKYPGHFDEIIDKNNSIKLVPNYNSLAKTFRETNVLKASDKGNYVYKDGYWQPIQDVEFDNIVARITKNQAQPNHIDSFKKLSKANCFFNIAEHHGEPMKINLSNGVYDIKEKNLVGHSSRFYFKQKLPISYDPKAKCPKWIDHLSFVLKEDQELISLVKKMFGYILIGGDPFLHKAFVLYGSGRNGKSVVVDILRDVLGRSSSSAVSMANIHKPFSAVMLEGKLANIVEETPNSEINSEVFKNAVGGGLIQVSYKGKDEFNLRNRARFVFACNDMPVFKDKNNSLLDRLIFIPFDVYIPEDRRDTQILSKLRSELSGILNWAIEGANEIIENPKIEQPKASIDLKEEYKMESDPLYMWFSRCISFEDDPQEISSGQIYVEYKNYMDSNGFYPVSSEKFMKRFKVLVRDSSYKSGRQFDDDLRIYVGCIGTNKKRVRGFNVFRIVSS